MDKTTIDFYYSPDEPKCHLVDWACNRLKLQVNKILIHKNFDRLVSQEKFEELKEKCPLLEDMAPVIVHQGVILNESRAIVTYLFNRFAHDDDPLYPKDPIKRAKIDTILYWDATTLCQTLHEFYSLRIHRDRDSIRACKSAEKVFRNSLKMLDIIVDKSQFSTGDELTVADISIVCNLFWLECYHYDISEFKNVTKFIANVKESAALPKYTNSFADIIGNKVNKHSLPSQALESYQLRIINEFLTRSFSTDTDDSD